MIKKKGIPQPKRYLKHVTNGTVWTWTEQLSKRADLTEISEAEAKYINGEGPKPADIVMIESIPADLVNILSKLDPTRMGQMQALAQAIDAGGAINLPSPQAVPQPQQAQVVDSIKPPSVVDEIEPPAPVETEVEGDEEVEDLEAPVPVEDNVTADSLKKPPNKMNKTELAAYAMATFGLDFDSTDLTKKEMLAKIQEKTNV